MKYFKRYANMEALLLTVAFFSFLRSVHLRQNIWDPRFQLQNVPTYKYI